MHHNSSPNFFWSLILQLFALMASVVDFIKGVFSLNSTVYFEQTQTKVRVKGKRHIGEGAYSMVYKACLQYDKSKQFALKRMLVQSEEAEKMVQVEVEAFQRFKHPNILCLLDMTHRTEGGLKAVYLLFPLVKNGSLRDVLTEISNGHRPKPTVVEVLQRFIETCHAFNVLHQFKPSYVHQDIKPENVLIAEDGTPLLTDFGSVRLADINVNTRNDALTVMDNAASFCTAPYRAPELYNPTTGSKLDTRTDVWGIGCLLYAWWFGYSPFECEYHGATMRVVECSSLRVLSPIPRTPHPSVDDKVILDLAEWILNVDYEVRPFTSDIIVRVSEVIEAHKNGK